MSARDSLRDSLSNCNLNNTLPGERDTLALTNFYSPGSIGVEITHIQDPEYRASGQCAWINPSQRQLVIPAQAAFDFLRVNSPAAVISQAKPKEAQTWHNGSVTAALEYTVTVGNHTIDLIRPVARLTQNKNLPTNDQIAKAIRTIPAYQRSATTKIIVNHIPIPRPANTPLIQADAGSGTINYYPFRRPTNQWIVDARSMHEFGHNFHNTVWNSSANVSRWGLARNLDVISPSAYAQTAIQEDFCEFNIIYIIASSTNCENQMRKLYPNRCSLMDQYRRGG